MRRIGWVYAVLMMLLVPLTLDSSSGYHDVSTLDISTTSDVEVKQMLPDRYLDHQTSYYVGGDSGEFSFTHYPTLDDYNSVCALEFNHIANTTLVRSGGYPEEDCVFFVQEFEWRHEVLPITATVGYGASIDLTGDFATYGDTWDKRRLGLFQVWIIDSLGNWVCCVNNYLPPDSYYEWYSRDIGGFIDETWDGLIEDIQGVQDDPEDTLKVAFLFRPSFHFFNGPSKTLNGSITVKVHKVELVVSLPVDLDESRRLSPVWKSAWNPRELIEASGDIYQTSLKIGPNDSVYASGFVHFVTTEGFNQTPFRKGFIINWDSEANMLWSTPSDDNTTIRDMVLTEDSIFTVGTKYGGLTEDIVICRYSLDGVLIWNEIYDMGCHENGWAIDTDSESTCYVSATRTNSTTDEWLDPCIIKVNSTGNFISSNIVPKYTGYLHRLVLVNDTYIYTIDSFINYPGLLTKWSTDFEKIGDIGSVKLVESYGENLFIATTFEDTLSISKLDQNLTREWRYNISLEYAPIYPERFDAVDMKVDSNGSLVVLVHLSRFAYEYRLYRFHLNGTLEWDKLIGPENARFDYDPNFLALGNNGLAYVSGRMPDDQGIPFSLEAYIYGNYTLPSNPWRINLVTLGVVLIGGLTILSLVVVLKRRVNENLQ